MRSQRGSTVAQSNGGNEIKRQIMETTKNKSLMLTQLKTSAEQKERKTEEKKHDVDGKTNDIRE